MTTMMTTAAPVAPRWLLFHPLDGTPVRPDVDPATGERVSPAAQLRGAVARAMTDAEFAAYLAAWLEEARAWVADLAHFQRIGARTDSLSTSRGRADNIALWERHIAAVETALA